MINFHKNHQALVLTLFSVFVILSIGIAVIPAYQMKNEIQPLANDKPMTKRQLEGLKVYISEGCVACHTQQVRNIEMDKPWGPRPSLPSDYYYSKQRMDVWRQSPSILGSERTGPDLTNIGRRQPSKAWHLMHLYNPRSVVDASIMPAYPWLFEAKENPEEEDVVVPVSETFVQDTSKKIVAKEKALKLVEYLLSLKQPKVSSQKAVEFLSTEEVDGGKGKAKAENDTNTAASAKPDGAALYSTTCASCHQSDGQGLKGAFPSLAGSDIVNAKNPEKHIKIILTGYNEHDKYAAMPAFGDQLTNEEIAAIANHERSSWGNEAPKVTPEQVKKIRESIKNLAQ